MSSWPAATTAVRMLLSIVVLWHLIRSNPTMRAYIWIALLIFFFYILSLLFVLPVLCVCSPWKFKDIYQKADENTRRAMNKSFQTSGGTVLSTNWSEVGDADYETKRKAPKGMEWKT